MNMDTIAACSGGPAAEADRFGPKVGRHLMLFCIHQMNWMNYCNGSAMMPAS